MLENLLFNLKTYINKNSTSFSLLQLRCGYSNDQNVLFCNPDITVSIPHCVLKNVS